jgi:hypothetical protein
MRTCLTRGFAPSLTRRIVLVVFIGFLMAPLLGTFQASAATLIFGEDFETQFPEDGGWEVGDQNPNGIPAFWEDVNLLEFGVPPPRESEWVGYCAGIGYAGGPLDPRYQNEMGSYMSRVLDLRGYTSVTLKFWHTVSSLEVPYDLCAVFIDQQIVYSISDVFGWIETTIDLTPYAGTQPELAFVFFSDESVQGEGWYLDDIEVTGINPILRGPYLQSATTSNIIVCWRSDVPVPSRVVYGTNALQLDREVLHSVAKTDHAITLSGLEPDTRYYYGIVVETNLVAAGPEYYFVTSPLQPKPTRIWVIGDSGTAEYSTAPLHVRDAYQEFTGTRPTDVWLMLGDNAYGSGTDRQYQIAVFEAYRELLRNIPVWSTLGNHETYSSTPAGGYAYFDIFSFPTDGRAGGVPSGDEKYYSFDYGNIHFVCLDSEISNRESGSPMLTWLEQDLAASASDWLIAYWHSPPYTRGSHNSDSPFDGSGNMVKMRENVLPILEYHGVDLVLCGHSHSYERSHLLQNHYGYSDTLTASMIQDAGGGRPDESGAYVKDPAAGNLGTVYVVAGSSGQTSGGPLNHPAMFVSLNRLGSLVIDIDASRLDVRFLRETGVTDDYFSIIKREAEPLRLATFHASGGTLDAVFTSRAGTRYRIEASDQLENPNWVRASADFLATHALTRWTSPLTNSSDRCFFRVVRVP